MALSLPLIISGLFDIVRGMTDFDNIIQDSETPAGLTIFNDV